MNKFTHTAVAGLTAAAFVASNYNDPTFLGMVEWIPPVVVLPAIAGGLIMDIDIEGSSEGRRHPFLAKHLTHRGITHTGIAAVLTLLLLIPMRGQSDNLWLRIFFGLLIGSICSATLRVLLPFISKQLKGLSKACVIALDILCVVYMAFGFVVPIIPKILYSLLIGYGIGALSHVLYADSLNFKGVPVFFPLIGRKVHVMRVATGTWEETMFQIVFIGAMVVHIGLILGGFTL